MLRPHPRFFLQSLLLILVLTMQLLVLAHESVHEFSADSDQCWVCLHGSVFESAAPATDALSVAAAREQTCPRQYAPAIAVLPCRIHHARGPPPFPTIT